MRRYETIYILRPTLSEDEVNEVIEKTNAILCNGEGQIIAIDKWGLRKLAYLIKKESQGYYVFCDHGTDSANVTEMERIFRIDDAVMKYLTIKVADTIDTEGIEAARGEYEAAKVAAAEAEEEAQAEEKVAQPAKEKAAEPAKEKVAEPAKEKVAEPAEVKAAQPAEVKAAQPAEEQNDDTKEVASDNE
jgi:small subunit ribosomal protein S6